MPSFPSGAVEKLPWRELTPYVVTSDRPASTHFAMSPMSRSLQRLRKQWSACEEWEKYEERANDEWARSRYLRRIQTPEVPPGAAGADGADDEDAAAGGGRAQRYWDRAEIDRDERPTYRSIYEMPGTYGDQRAPEISISNVSRINRSSATADTFTGGHRPSVLDGVPIAMPKPPRSSGMGTDAMSMSTGGTEGWRRGLRGVPGRPDQEDGRHYRYKEIMTEYLTARIRNL